MVDAYQGRGLGTALLDTVMTVASVSGIDRIQATVLPSNDRSLRLLGGIGMTFRIEDGLLEGTAPVRLLATPVVDRAAVVRLAVSRSRTDWGAVHVGMTPERSTQPFAAGQGVRS